MTTARKIIYAALGLLGLQYPTSEKLDGHLITLNNILSSWAVDKLNIYSVVSENFNISSNSTVRTIGPGGNLVTALRPTKILDGAYLRSGNTDYPLTPMKREEYAQIESKIATGRPGRYYYAPEYPLGRIYFNYATDIVYTLYIDSQKPFTEFTTLETVVSFPLEYKLALQYNLAMALSPEYPEAKLSGAVKEYAGESLKRISDNNSEPTEGLAKLDSCLRWGLAR